VRVTLLRNALFAGSAALLIGWAIALAVLDRLVGQLALSEFDGGDIVLTRQRFEQLSALNSAVTWLLPLGATALLIAIALLVVKRLGPSRKGEAERS
jgi:hypothetical protein